MTISDSRDVNCRANAPGPGPLNYGLGAQIIRTHRGPGAADFGGAKGMEGARLQSARALRFAPLAGRRPTEQRRFVRLLAGPLQSGAVVGGIQRPLPVPHTMRSAVRLLCSNVFRGFRADPIRNQPARVAA